MDSEMNEKENKEEYGPLTLHDILEMVIYVACVFLLALLIVTFVGQRTVVSGSSMETTLSDGDNLIIDKVSYKFRAPKRFEIVVFPEPGQKDTYFIKRVIGLPGETIQITQDGKIYINGQVLEENYGREVILDPGNALIPITLADDEYFVLGDNRNNSLDSRYQDVGPLKADRFVGRALCRIYPFNKICGLLPKGE